MRYRRFEDLPVWNDAIDLAVQIYAMTSRTEFRTYRSLRDQMERAAVSVSNNIAEGFERGTNNELLAFLYISRGSAGEVRSMLCLLERIPSFRPLYDNVKSVKQQAESCSRQLKGGSSHFRILTSKASVTSTRKLKGSIRPGESVKSFSTNSEKSARKARRQGRARVKHSVFAQ